jgi:glycosyltransferase involved in cell wall biosynthesis
VLPDEYFLILVGTGPQENELKHLSRELKIDSRIKFVGKVEHKEVSKYYSVADCFIFPSTTETQGIALLEAAYFNLPCVAVDSKVNREWTVRKASFISKSTVSAFENAILKCRSLDKAIVKEKTDEFAKKYTAERTARMTLGFYDELIEEETRKKNFKNRLATKLNSLEKYIDRIIE